MTVCHLLLQLLERQHVGQGSMYNSKNSFQVRDGFSFRQRKFKRVHNISKEQKKFHSSEHIAQTHTLTYTELQEIYRVAFSIHNEALWLELFWFRVQFGVHVHFIYQWDDMCSGRDGVAFDVPVPAI